MYNFGLNIGVIALGLILTIAHTIYALYAYDNSSIIHFVSKELWRCISKQIAR